MATKHCVQSHYRLQSLQTTEGVNNWNKGENRHTFSMGIMWRVPFSLKLAGLNQIKTCNYRRYLAPGESKAPLSSFVSGLITSAGSLRWVQCMHIHVMGTWFRMHNYNIMDSDSCKTHSWFSLDSDRNLSGKVHIPVMNILFIAGSYNILCIIHFHSSS